MTQAMLRQFDDIFDYRRYLPSEVNDVIRKAPFYLKNPNFLNKTHLHRIAAVPPFFNSL